MKRSVLVFLLVGWAAGLAECGKLIVVMIDGCRWNCTDDPKLDLKGIPKIIRSGVKAPFVYPVFPSSSYPNWYSIVTGLYPENHGFVNNLMYDNKTGTQFLMLPEKGSTDAYWWNEAEPIWVTAEKQGKNTAMYWWAGCEIQFDGYYPMICERHRYGPGTEEEKTDFLERIDDVVEMFRPSKMERLSLALMYYGPVDYNGHYSGPDSDETRRALSDIDDILNKMQHKLEKAGLQDEVNIMVVSDHGMTDVQEPNTKYVDLAKFESNIKYQASYGATCMLVAEDGMAAKLYNDLQEAKLNGIRVYSKEAIPESFHIKNSDRTSDIFLLADKGYFIKALRNDAKRIGDYPEPTKGHHGYDPAAVMDMRTIFFARGPDFRKDFTSPPLYNTDLYHIMCKILAIQPLPNNGSLERIKDIYSTEGSSELIAGAGSHRVQCFLQSFVILLASLLFAVMIL